MEVRFWRFEKRFNSTKQPPTECNNILDCQLKEPTQVENPTIIVKRSSWSVSLNYCHIPTFGCFYFVSDATYDTGGRVIVSLSIDRLATYRNYIMQYTCFVERSASNYNDLFDDNYVSNTENIVHRASAETHPGQNFSGSGCYTIRCIGGGKSSTTGIQTYVTNEAGVYGFLNALFTPSQYSFLSDEVVKSFFNPFQYVVEIKWMPVSFRSLVGGNAKTANMVAGWFDTGQIGYELAVDGVTASTSIAVPANIYSDFKAYSNRFSSYTMFLPAVGTIPVNAADAMSGLNSTLKIDALTGIAQYTITSGNGNVGTYKTQMGVPMQIGQLNSSFLNMTGGLAGAVMSGISGNFVGMASDLVQSAKSAFNPTMSINGANGDKYTFVENDHIKVSVECRGAGERATSVAGRPCYKTLRLGTLSGFTKCGNASIQLAGYNSDMTEINNMLNSGVYIE